MHIIEVHVQINQRSFYMFDYSKTLFFLFISSMYMVCLVSMSFFSVALIMLFFYACFLSLPPSSSTIQLLNVLNFSSISTENIHSSLVVKYFVTQLYSNPFSLFNFYISLRLLRSLRMAALLTIGFSPHFLYASASRTYYCSSSTLLSLLSQILQQLNPPTVFTSSSILNGQMTFQIVQLPSTQLPYSFMRKFMLQPPSSAKLNLKQVFFPFLLTYSYSQESYAKYWESFFLRFFIWKVGSMTRICILSCILSFLWNLLSQLEKYSGSSASQGEPMRSFVPTQLYQL